MAEKSTIARPYAQAIFGLAAESKQLSEWSDMLKLVATIAADDKVKGLIGNPRIKSTELAQLFFDVCGDALNDKAKNLINILIENGRLDTLPEIAAQYEVYKAEAEKVVQAEVITAYAMTEDQQKNIAASLKARLGCEVSLECKMDNSLIGGAIIRAGDMVIDGSVTSHLDRLANALSH